MKELFQRLRWRGRVNARLATLEDKVYALENQTSWLRNQVDILLQIVKTEHGGTGDGIPGRSDRTREP